jgi:hypothetical protein
MSAEFKAENAGAPAFKVEVLLPDGTTQTAMVNAMGGTVQAMAGDTGDQNGEDGENGEGNENNN